MMIKPELLALYGGPDQIMGLASGVATVVGLLLMFWNKVLVTCGKVINYIKPSGGAEEPPHEGQ
jgi:hypothetical protein